MDEPSLKTCPNCGQPVRDEYALCPFCGTDMETGQRPKRVGEDADEPSAVDEGVKSGTAAGCVLSGSVFFVTATYSAVARTVWVQKHWHGTHRPALPLTLTWAQSVIPLALLIFWFLAARRRTPTFARGLGYSIIISAALSLGALAVCR